MVSQRVPRRRRLGGLVVAAVATAALTTTGCGSGGNSDTGSSTSDGTVGLQQGETLKVGFAASQTGDFAVFDQPVLKGVQASVDNTNKNGGIDGKVKIDLMVEDAKSDPSTTGTVAQDLISRGAQFLIAPCDTDPALPAGQLAQKDGIPIITCGSGASFPAQVGDVAFLSVYGTEVMGRAMAEFAKSKGYQTAYVLTSHDLEYTDSMMVSAAKRFQGMGGKILGTAEFSLSQARFTTQATQIASAHPDVVITSVFLPQSVTFLKNLRAAGYDGPVIGNDGQLGAETFGAGPAAKNVYLMGYGYPSDDAAGRRFKQWDAMYEKTTGEQPGSPYPMFGGDIVCLIDAAVTQAQSTDPAKVRDAMANLVDTPCPSGSFTYKGQNGVPKRAVAVLETNVATKQFDGVKRFTPQGVEGG